MRWLEDDESDSASGELGRLRPPGISGRHPAFLEKLRDEQPTGDVRYRFWQCGGDDGNVRVPATSRTMIECLRNNPARRGLVRETTAWPWPSDRQFSRNFVTTNPMMK